MRATTALLLVAVSFTACSSSQGDKGPDEPGLEPCTVGVRCDGECVSPGQDSRHCGRCGNACGEDEFCDDGTCEPSCAPHQTRCGQTPSECTDVSSDPMNCGGCFNACSPGAFCVDGSCLTDCEGPWLERCGDVCANTATDDRNCGGCGVACADGAACVDGSCACPEGSSLCDEACIDTSASPAHCGGCGNACAEGESCFDGACACADGGERCDGACVDTDADPAHCGGCGISCANGTSCVDGACACPDGLALCDGACVDTGADRDHCGECGNACTSGASCADGVCACPEGLTLCDGACVDTAADVTHCGGCGLACTAGDRSGATCESGECGLSCYAPFLDCDDDAATGCEVDPAVDAAHCGGCGLACGGSQVCTSGVCCEPGEAVCGGACVNPLADDSNCGACGLSCQGWPDSSGGACVAGRCELACDPMRGDCNADSSDGCELDLTTDRGNCGACGNGCGALCGAGACVAVAFPASLSHTSCALSADGRVFCWGQNVCGQVGNAAPQPNCRNVNLYSGVPEPTEVPQLGAVGALYAGEYHTCVLGTDGGAKCWGANDKGQLGAGDTAIHTGPMTVMDGAVPLQGATALALTDSSTCALVAGGVKCWGNGANGRLGNGAALDSLVPVPVTSGAQALSGAIGIAAGKGHVCALLQGGSVACWGHNNNGQLGGGVGDDLDAPATIAGLAGVDQLVAAGYRTCARIGGAAKCWGQNLSGQLGDGTTVNRPTPVDVLNVATAVSITAGPNHACAVLSGGGALCWGLGSFGQLGNGVISFTGQPTPSAVIDEVSGLPRQDIRSMTAGGAHSCMVTVDDTAWCWGLNLAGQAGDGTIVNVTSPAKVAW